jgi:hypothetical protein
MKEDNKNIKVTIIILLVVALLVFFFFYNKKMKKDIPLTEKQLLIQEAQRIHQEGPAINLSQEEKEEIIEQAQTIQIDKEVKVQLSQEEMNNIINQAQDTN